MILDSVYSIDLINMYESALKLTVQIGMLQLAK